MHQRTKAILATVGIAGLVFVGATVGIAGLVFVGTDAVTYAGTGDSLILGKVNKSKKTTHVTSSGKGPALSLHAKGKRPALAVDSTAKVVKLNADTVDGKHAKSLRNNVRVYTATSGSSTNGAMNFELPNFPNGRYQATYSVTMYGAYGSTTNPTSGECLFHRSGADVHPGFTSSTLVGYDLGLSASDLIKQDDATWGLYCSAIQHGIGPRDWSISSGEPVRVTLTRIDKTIGGKLATSRVRPDADRVTRRGS